MSLQFSPYKIFRRCILPRAYAERLLALSCALACFGFVSCSPHLKQTMPVPEVPISIKDAGSKGNQSSFVFVDEIKDTRTNPRLAEINGKESAPDGPVGPSVQTALSEALKQGGFLISDSAPVMISGEVREWSARVEGGMAAKVESIASVYLEVFDPANKRIFSGSYHGSSSRQSPSLKEKDVRDSLGVAMSQAIQQVLVDEQLMKLLASF